jgi:hypothetical protein
MTVEIREGRGCGPNGEYIHLHLDHLPAEVRPRPPPAPLTPAVALLPANPLLSARGGRGSGRQRGLRLRRRARRAAP